jgi:addiction module RelE/StbE family toxin
MAKKYYIRWTTPAREDLNEIIDYISETNLSYATKVLDNIEGAVQTLHTSPKKYRIVPEFERFGVLSYREIIVEYWRIIFKIEEEYVYIMLVIDGRRNLEDLILKKIMFRDET